MFSWLAKQKGGMERFMNNKTHQIRCPKCNGRLFDVTVEKNAANCIEKRFAILIKCWKCHKTVSLEQSDNFDYLVQASYEYNENGVEA